MHDEDSEQLTLRSCPFCGERPSAEIGSVHNPARTVVRCDNDRCPVGPEAAGDTPRLAQGRWNSRSATVRLHRVGVSVSKK